MRNDLSLAEFTDVCSVLTTLKRLGLLQPYDYMVTWEKKPQLTINRMGDFEFTNPQEIYGCVVTFWDAQGHQVSKTRFNIKDA